MACTLALSNDFITKILKAVTNQMSYSSPATVYLALYTSNPNPNNSGTEVSGTFYARQSIAWNAVSGQMVTNSGTITFPTAGSNWGTITYLAIFDAVSSGNLIAFAQATAAITINTGQTYLVSPANLSLALQ